MCVLSCRGLPVVDVARADLSPSLPLLRSCECLHQKRLVFRMHLETDKYFYAVTFPSCAAMHYGEVFTIYFAAKLSNEAWACTNRWCPLDHKLQNLSECSDSEYKTLRKNWISRLHFVVFLIGCFLFSQFWQLYNSVILFKMTQLPECKEWQVRALLNLFLHQVLSIPEWKQTVRTRM